MKVFAIMRSDQRSDGKHWKCTCTLRQNVVSELLSKLWVQPDPALPTVLRGPHLPTSLFPAADVAAAK